jgi:flagellar basal body-associated protein FliL
MEPHTIKDVSVLYVLLLDDIVFMVGACGYLRWIVILSVCVVLLCARAVLTILMFNLDAGLLASNQYSEGPATGHLGTGFFLGFPVSNSKCSDGSQNSKLPLHAPHVALPK